MNYDDLAELYSLQYAHYRDDIDFYSRLAERIGVQKILELGAGQGRVAVALARRGHNMTGLEISEQMLNRAKVFAQQENVNIHWHKADMRNFKLSERWPYIIAPFNALMHLYNLQDQDACLACVRQHLEPNGVFAFDLYQPNFGTEGVLRHEGETFKTQDGGRTDVVLHQKIDRVSQMALTTYFVDSISIHGNLQRRVLELKQRYYTHFELQRMFVAQGFDLELHGNFDASRLLVNSPHFVGVARLH